jgi:hypothetical protein
MVHASPLASSKVVGKLPRGTQGLRNLGCKGEKSKVAPKTTHALFP